MQSSSRVTKTSQAANVMYGIVILLLTAISSTHSEVSVINYSAGLKISRAGRNRRPDGFETLAISAHQDKDGRDDKFTSSMPEGKIRILTHALDQPEPEEVKGKAANNTINGIPAGRRVRRVSQGEAVAGEYARENVHDEVEALKSGGGIPGEQVFGILKDTARFVSTPLRACFTRGRGRRGVGNELPGPFLRS